MATKFQKIYCFDLFSKFNDLLLILVFVLMLPDRNIRRFGSFVDCAHLVFDPFPKNQEAAAMASAITGTATGTLEQAIRNTLDTSFGCFHELQKAMVTRQLLRNILSDFPKSAFSFSKSLNSIEPIHSCGQLA